MIRNQSGLTGLNGAKNRIWLAAFVWHTRIVKSKQPSFAWKLARRAGVGFALFRLGRFIPGPPTAGKAIQPSAENFPRIIWMYWHDGEDAAPGLVRYCISTWRRHNPDWDVRVLDSSNASDYVDIDYVPAGTRLQLVADALRLELLDRYGGVWADVTCLCTGPLADWLMNRLGEGFFAFARPGPDRPLGNWFLASLPGSPLVASWLEVSRLYWRNGFQSNHIGETGRRDQFIYHYLFEWMINSRRQLHSQWLSVPTLPAGPPHRLQMEIKRHSVFPSWRPPVASLIPDILSSPDVRVHKLDWRLDDALQILSIYDGTEHNVDHRDEP